MLKSASWWWPVVWQPLQGGEDSPGNHGMKGTQFCALGANSRCYFSLGSVSISRPRHMTVTESKKGIYIGTRGGVQREARDFILKFLRMSWTWVFFFFLFVWKQRSEKWNSEGQRGHNPSVFKPRDPPGNLTPTGTEVRAASGVLAETLLEKHSVHENQE